MLDFLKKHKNDLILMSVILSIALVGFIILKLTAENGKKVNVIIDGKLKYTYSLNEDIKTIIKTDDNENTLVIKDGCVSIQQANCPDKICVSHRKISNVGETIVCIPNKVVIEIE